MALPEWLVKEIDGVGDHSAFAGVDELERGLRTLAAGYPEITTLRRVGTSRHGEPLLCLTIDGEPGDPTALVFGLPHPNEPIGGLTALHLAARLCADPGLRGRLRHRWRVIACIDPDGLRLNEGWLAGPFTREHYARHFYRPAGPDQVEWTFPLDYKDAYFDAALPETQALMRLIDSDRPGLVCSLHNSELGGVYYYLSRAEPPLHLALQALPGHVGLPLDRGEPEAPYITRLDDAIFQGTSISRAYDYLTGLGEPWTSSAGDNTASYAGRYGALTLVTELPYWTSDTADDDGPAGTGYASALAAHARALADLSSLMAETIEAVAGALMVPDSPFWRASRSFATMMASGARSARSRSTSPEADRPATVAEVSSLAEATHSFRLRYGGILLRALDGELAVGNTRPVVRAARERVAARHAEWVAGDALIGEYRTIPIRQLVATQYGAVLAAAAQVAGVL
ncbi:M14 family zinc carboxypeptidase [Amycolatopsis sp. 3B14]|uniref:M14 family zinc carboxypeptidase n=1 Tax=Amycolatopsis sp. 3B14 TaxID=3243600 RepID=UPI003D95E92D